MYKRSTVLGMANAHSSKVGLVGKFYAALT